MVNKYFLTGDELMPQIHSKHPAAFGNTGFTYSVRKPFTKNEKRNQKVMKTGNTHYTNQNELDKSCFNHDMGYGN